MSSAYNFSSDSEDDDDYEPPKGVETDVSEEESEDSSDIEAPIPKKIKIDVDDKKVTLDVSAKKDNIWKEFLNSTNKSGKDLKPATLQSAAAANKEIAKVGINGEESVKPTIEAPVVEKKGNIEKLFPEEKKIQVADESPAPKNGLPVPEQKIEANAGGAKQVPIGLSGLFSGRSSLSSVLGSLGKEKKMTVLEKSLSDWKDFKAEEGIDKDLEVYNKGKQGFIERKRFLERSDFRSFETEKSARLAKKK